MMAWAQVSERPSSNPTDMTKSDSESVSGSVMSDSLRPHGLYSLPVSSVHGVLQARILEWVALPCPSSRNLPSPGIKPWSLALQTDSLPSEPPGKPINMAVHAKFLQSYPILCNPMDYRSCKPYGLSVSSVCGDSLGKNTGMGCHALLHGIFPTQGPSQRKIKIPTILHCYWKLRKVVGYVLQAFRDFSRKGVSWTRTREVTKHSGKPWQKLSWLEKEGLRTQSGNITTQGGNRSPLHPWPI